MKEYRVLRFLERRGDAVAVVFGLLPLAAMVAAWFFLGWSWYAIGAGAAGGALLWFFMRSYVELIRLIVDMLLPK